MERFIYRKQSIQPFYVFARQHFAFFHDDGLSISHAGSGYANPDADLVPMGPPYVRIPLLRLQFLRDVSIGELPLNIIFEAKRLGHIDQNAGYAAADMGQYQRDINSLNAKMTLENQCLTLQLRVVASAVNPQSAHGKLTERDLLSLELAYMLGIPWKDVPEVLNMDERTRRTFAKRCDASAISEQQQANLSMQPTGRERPAAD
jgi:hypothetical protein